MINEFLQLLEWKWFNSGQDGCVGVVFAFDRKLNMYHGYIGIGKGFSEEADCRHIISHGCRLTREETAAMLGSEKSRKLIDAIPEKNWKV